MPKSPRCALVGALALVLLAACGRSPDEEAAPSTTAAPAPSTSAVPATTTPVTNVDAVTTTQQAEPTTTVEKPDVELPGKIPTELVITEIEEGSGAAAANGDTVLVRYVGVRSEDGVEFDNNFEGGDPFPVTLGAGGVIQGWDEGLVGIKQGGRRQLDIPADLAYGDEPRGDVIQAGDALSFVVDALVVIPATDPQNAPKVPIEGAANVDEVTIDEQVEGDGATLEVGQTALVHYVALRGDTGESLGSTWDTGAPAPFTYVEEQMPSLLFEGLDGMKVGGRRIVSIPFAQVDAQSREQLGLPAEVDLVLILDVVAVY